MVANILYYILYNNYIDLYFMINLWLQWGIRTVCKNKITINSKVHARRALRTFIIRSSLHENKI